MTSDTHYDNSSLGPAIASTLLSHFKHIFEHQPNIKILNQRAHSKHGDRSNPVLQKVDYFGVARLAKNTGFILDLLVACVDRSKRNLQPTRQNVYETKRLVYKITVTVAVALKRVFESAPL